MRIMVALLFLWIPTALAGCASAPGSGPDIDTDLAITHVAVIDVERGRVIANQDVLIKGNRIIAVSPSGHVRLPSNAREIDGTRRYIIPGLWDTTYGR